LVSPELLSILAEKTFDLSCFVYCVDVGPEDLNLFREVDLTIKRLFNRRYITFDELVEINKLQKRVNESCFGESQRAYGDIKASMF
jgi:hypothetical protein